jgi:FlaA1/EpsC-like NDP-sugar epimerase
VEIVYTGVRPGEKLFEEISVDAENATKTLHPKIFIGRDAARPWAEVSAAVDRLLVLADGDDGPAILDALADLEPSYRAERGAQVIPLVRTAPPSLPPGARSER